MPTLASANRAALGYIAEVTPGTTPGAGTAKNIRFTGESLSWDLSKETSKEIRSDRQVPGSTTVDATAGGGFEFELIYREYDPFIAGVVGGTYTVYGTDGVGTSFAAAYTATTITAAVAPTGSSDFTTLQKGQWFKVIHAGNANDGKYFRVSTATAPTTTVITLDASTPATVVGSSAGCTLSASRLTNGTTQTAFTLERQLTDIAQFMTYKGMQVGKMSWKFASGALSTGSFDFLGMAHVRAGATALPSALGVSQNFSIQNGVRGIGQLWEGGAPLTSTYIKSLSLDVDANLRQQDALNNLGAVGIGQGDFKVSGSYEAYFADGTLYDKFLNDTNTTITVGTQDKAGNGYIVTLPNVCLMSSKVVAGSKNTDIMAQITYEAYADDTNALAALRKTIFIDRVGVIGQ